MKKWVKKSHSVDIWTLILTVEGITTSHDDHNDEEEADDIEDGDDNTYPRHRHQ
jgi:hypothetical protein